MIEYPPRWTCEVIELRVEAYLMGTLPRDDLLAIAEHIEACVMCAQLVAFLAEESRLRGSRG